MTGLVTPAGFGVMLVWTALVAASWVGWGSAAARWAGCRRVGVGLRASWGLAITVFLGGVLNATRTSYTPLVALLVFGGDLILVVFLFKVRRSMRRWAMRRWSWQRAVAVLPVVIALGYGAVVLAGSLATDTETVNGYDDPGLYLLMPQKMLHAGAAIDPLNIRRLSTFGGYSFLQAQIGVIGQETHAFVVDMGLAPLLLVLLLIDETRVGRRRWMIVPLAAVCWLYPMPRLNTMAEWVMAVTTLATLRTMLLADRLTVVKDGRTRRRLLIVAAVTATAGCTFRDNLIALPPLFFGFYFIVRFISGSVPRRTTAVETLLVLTTGVVCLMPWSLALYQAAGSPLYPLFKGNDPVGIIGYAGDMTAEFRRDVVIGTLGLTPFLLLYLPAILIIAYRRWTAAMLLIAIVSTCVMTIYAYPTDDPVSYERFCLPALTAVALYGMAVGLRRRPWVVCATLVWAGALLLTPARWPWVTICRQCATAVRAVSQEPTLYHPDLRRAYADLQQAIPPWAIVASAIDYPTLFDLGRNPVDSMDVPGAAIRGEWPFDKGPEALQRFFAEQGVQYVVWRDFRQADGLYGRAMWEQLLHGGEGNALTMLDFMQNLDRLAHTRALVYDHDGFRAIKISSESR